MALPANDGDFRARAYLVVRRGVDLLFQLNARRQGAL